MPLFSVYLLLSQSELIVPNLVVMVAACIAVRMMTLNSSSTGGSN